MQHSVKPIHSVKDFLAAISENKKANFEGNKLKAEFLKEKNIQKYLCFLSYFNGERFVRYSYIEAKCVADVISHFKEQVKIYEA